MHHFSLLCEVNFKCHLRLLDPPNSTFYLLDYKKPKHCAHN